MATNILIITTRDLPKIPTSIDTNTYNTIASKNINSYFKEQKINLTSFLQNYNRGNGVKRQVQTNIKNYIKQNTDIFPILKRVVNEQFVIYITLCLDSDNSGFPDKHHHGYLKALINDVVVDFGPEKDYSLYLLVHSTDLVDPMQDNTLSRHVDLSELKGFPDEIKNKIKQICIFVHEKSDDYYSIIKQVTSNNNLNYSSLYVMEC